MSGRPARHFAGRPVSEEPESESDADSSEEYKEEVRGSIYENNKKGLHVNISSVEISEITEDATSVKEEDRIVENEEKKYVSTNSPESRKGGTEEPDSGEEEEDTSGSESESESESEDEQAVFARPKFIPKSQRNKPTEKNKQVEEKSNATKERTLEIIESTIRSERAERNSAKLASTSLGDEEVLAIDDTDGIDPEQEFEDWKKREKARMKRDRDIIVQMEMEKEAAEELRLMTEEERQKLHQERKAAELETTDSEFKPKSYHKGAFYQDDELVKSRDFSGSVEGSFKHTDTVPDSLRDQTRLGTKGKTRHHTLRQEDTTDTNYYKRFKKL